MAGRSPSEEMDAFDDVTPAKAVSIYDLDEDLPTRAQSSEEIAEFQAKAREKAKQKTAAAAKPPAADADKPPDSAAARDSAFRSFRPPTDSSNPAISVTGTPPSGERRPSDPGSGSNPRPVPRESGPVRIDRYRPAAAPPPRPPAPDPGHLDDIVNDVAATLDRFPPAPRVPKIEQPRGSLETIPMLSRPTPTPAPAAPRRWTWMLAAAIVVSLVGWAAFAFFR